MNSTELPITEWWDPEWDVYSVPLSPFDPDVDVETWWAAYEHQWLLGWIMSGTAANIPADFQHQLTTGHDPLCSVETDEACSKRVGCRDTVSCTCGWETTDTPIGAYSRIIQIDPDCPYHWQSWRLRRGVIFAPIDHVQWDDLRAAWKVLDDQERRGD